MPRVQLQARPWGKGSSLRSWQGHGPPDEPTRWGREGSPWAGGPELQHSKLQEGRGATRAGTRCGLCSDQRPGLQMDTPAGQSEKRHRTDPEAETHRQRNSKTERQRALWGLQGAGQCRGSDRKRQTRVERGEETGGKTQDPARRGCGRGGRSPLRPLFQVPSQPVFLLLTGGSFAGGGLFSAREVGGVQRSVYHPLGRAACLHAVDLSG